MALKINSEWLGTEVELVKTLRDLSFSGYDDENSTADYESRGEEDTIVKVFIGRDGQTEKADLESVKQIVSDYDEADYGDVILMAEKFTPSAVDYVNGRSNFALVTPRTEMNLGVLELLSAIQSLTMKLCMRRCGEAPETEEDCEGYEKGRLVCPVRCISDNADFHAEMGWVRQLRIDFENLVKVEKADQ